MKRFAECLISAFMDRSIDVLLGPISVTVHIPVPSLPSFSSPSMSTFTLASLPSSHPSVRALRELHTLYHSSPVFSEWVDVHLALSPFASLTYTKPSPRTFPTPLPSNVPHATAEEQLPEQQPPPPNQEPDITGSGGRQFNVWRNAARLFARTAFVMMLDVDFAVCTDWRGEIRDAIKQAGQLSKEDEARQGSSPGSRLDVGARWRVYYGKNGDKVNGDEMESKTVDAVEVLRRVKDGRAALVVPAFEYVRQEDGLDQWTFPTNKEVRPILH